MIKRIIFDVDDTLIKFTKENWVVSYTKLIKKYHIANKKAQDIYEAIDEYEKTITKYEMETFLKFLSTKLETNLNEEFFQDLNNEIATNWIVTPSPSLISLLTFLSGQCELVILTNYFTDVYKKRLANMGILKFFTDIKGGDYFVKPNPLAYAQYLKDINPAECLMIGDSLEKDILTPAKMGIKVIMYDAENRYPDLAYPRVTNYEELKSKITTLFL